MVFGFGKKARKRREERKRKELEERKKRSSLFHNIRKHMKEKKNEIKPSGNGMVRKEK